jgi:hypothetical protein
MAPGARIAARVERRGEAVALVLSLPDGAAPEGEAARLLAEAATATGGRIETAADGVTLAWPRARG